MKRMKSVAAIALSTVMAVSLAGCGTAANTGAQPAEESAASEQAAAQPQAVEESGEQVKLVFLRAGTEESKKEAFTELLADFEKEYPNYTVEYQEAPWGNDIETKLNTAFASGTAPDVINFSLASIGSRVPLGQYECLDSYVEGYEGMDDYYESMLNAGSIGGKLYGLPYLADARMLAINTEMFEEAGLDPDNPPATWEELLEAHEKLVKVDDSGNVVQCGLGVPTSGNGIDQWLEIFAVQNGETNHVNESTNEIYFNDPGYIEAMEYLKQLKDIGLIDWDSSQSDTNPFRYGAAAMTILNSDAFKTLNTGDLEGKIKMVPMFGNKRKATFCGVHFMFMSADSKHKEAAWELIQFLCRKENVQKYCDMVGIAPLRQSLEDWYLNESGDEYAGLILESIEIGVAAPKVSYAQLCFNYIAEAMEKVFYGQSSVEDALNDAAADLQAEIDNQ